MDGPRSLTRSISPPPVATHRKTRTDLRSNKARERPRMRSADLNISELAAIEAGKAIVHNHLDYFSRQLAQVAKPVTNQSDPRLSIGDYTELYRRNSHSHGRHFVIHQHNHPIAGCHYDLRLQFSETSSCSFAIPSGLPGNPNSQRQGRMAIETRVHTLWNSLIESASHATGSLLIWDTGEYEVLPRKALGREALTTDDELSEHELTAGDASSKERHENEKLMEAFKARYIRLKLHGTRLPREYTIVLRLPSANDVVKHPRPIRLRKRKYSKSTNISGGSVQVEQDLDRLVNDEAALASEDDDCDAEIESIRANNAYTGAENTIGSVHQRRWFITLDRRHSGFVKEGRTWVRAGPDRGFEAFYVRGADVERSVVTGRTSAEVMADEGVEGFVPRKKWRPVLE
ncbi:uncharacterized protein PV09_02184 [Verruconis gallopava]|uniref:DNA ligase D 3'-phosphoesterase domain-containing protein n=1 Tax=Verruconis gallopava TaxID=253628 RepID=A0A0D2ALE1_9PEZI|nr:uncharacterized protein PV09_02184 [Verruconis gallopava]KIW07335.1 hypothetical protein PV09_02184 [Verruconis gallopava]